MAAIQKTLRQTPADFAALSKALADAESKTTGRITAVYAQQAPGYDLVYLVYAMLIVALTTPIMLLLGASAMVIMLGQLSLFITAYSLLRFTSLGPALVPAFIKARLVEAFAKSVNDQSADDQPHVLLVVSKQERYARIVPNAALAGRIPQKIWGTLLESLMIDLGHGDFVRGMRNTTVACTKLFEVYFPAAEATGGSANRFYRL